MALLTRLFSPKSIAIIGGRIAESVVVELRKLGYGGDIWPVNPNRENMDGIVCFKSIQALPGVPDAAYIAVSREPTVELVQELAAMGAGGAICHASGFSELGENGKNLTQKLLDAAGGMPVLGPNCWGLLNLIDKTAMWPDFHGCKPVDSGVAIISQSGNMSINYTMQQRGLPIAYVVNLGNQAMLDANDCIEAFLDEPRVTAIGIHVEGLRDTARFSELALKARARGVPLVALKSGASEKGARATLSHTSTLAGSDVLYDALFARCAVARARSVPAFLEMLKLFSLFGPLSGNKIASLSCSGGEASLIADRSENLSVTFPELTPNHAEVVRATLNDYVDVTNPLDYHTFIWGRFEEMKATYGAMMKGAFDLTALVFDYPRKDRSKTGDYDEALRAWSEAAEETGAKTAIIATLPECMPESVAEQLYAAGIAPLSGMEEALDAIEAAAKLSNTGGEAIRRSRDYPDNVQTLDEWESKELLKAAGVPAPKGKTVTAAEAGDAAEEIGFPVAMKAIGEGLEHKSEAGGVMLNLTTRPAVEDAAEKLSKLSSALLIEEMVTDAVVELIIGIDRDRQFGPYLVVGAGGVLVEILRDSEALLLPPSRQEIETALRKLKMFPLLEGYRGNPPGDLEAAIDAIAAVAQFTMDHWDNVAEIDVNPMLIRPKGKGVVAADALIRLRKDT
ncbi:MAG: acetate--CoA ligase family protein [Hyphomicrobiales bacterium]